MRRTRTDGCDFVVARLGWTPDDAFDRVRVSSQRSLADEMIFIEAADDYILVVGAGCLHVFFRLTLNTF